MFLILNRALSWTINPVKKEVKVDKGIKQYVIGQIYATRDRSINIKSKLSVPESSQYQMPDNQNVSHSPSTFHQKNHFNFLALVQSKFEKFSLKTYKISKQQLEPVHMIPGQLIALW